jgi:hypothetical protein
MYGLICKNNHDTVRLFEGKAPVTVSEVPKTKILIWTANPKGQAWLRLGDEVRAARQCLKEAKLSGHFEIFDLGAVHTEDLLTSLQDMKPQIVQFSGHGTEKGELALERLEGHAQLVSSDALAGVFKLLDNDDRPKCVLLNACYSSSSGLVDKIYEYIDCVIGMEGPIEDAAAISFVGGFYERLFRGYEPSRAFEAGCNRIALDGGQGEPALRNRPSAATSMSTSQRIEIESTQDSEITKQFYVERSVDQIALKMIEGQGGVTLTIKGTGKTWLRRRIQNAAKQKGKTVVVLDFKKIVDKHSKENEDKFYKLFCIELTDELRKESDSLGKKSVSLGKIWGEERTNIQRCTSYMEEHILPMYDHLVLVMEQVDTIYDMEFRSYFFWMLRVWHEKRGDNSIWGKLDLVILHEMEPLIDKGGSPFNVGKCILLRDFTLTEMQELNYKYNAP